jgi:hypothetical protein
MKLNRFLVVVVAASEVNERSFNGSRIGEKLMMTTAGKRNHSAARHRRGEAGAKAGRQAMRIEGGPGE